MANTYNIGIESKKQLRFDIMSESLTGCSNDILYEILCSSKAAKNEIVHTMKYIIEKLRL